VIASCRRWTIGRPSRGGECYTRRQAIVFVFRSSVRNNVNGLQPYETNLRELHIAVTDIRP